MAHPPRVSVLVPTLNAERDLDRLLPALAQQEVAGGFELRVVDSDSTDATRPLLRNFGAQVQRIDRSTFRHGPTRNQLAQGAAGEILVFLSQDAVPQGPRALADLIEPFQDAGVAGTTARVLPHPGDDLLTTRTVMAAPEASETRQVFGRGDEGLIFNNVTSALRTSVWRETPLPDVPFGEDLAWARAALELGHRIVFEPRCVVHHAHVYSPGQAFERYRVDAAFRRRECGQQVRPNLASVAKGVAFELREDWRFARRDGRWWQLGRAPLLRGAQVLGQYCGSKGWNPLSSNKAATRAYG